jgi:hypothetical protein
MLPAPPDSPMSDIPPDFDPITQVLRIRRGKRVVMDRETVEAIKRWRKRRAKQAATRDTGRLERDNAPEGTPTPDPTPAERFKVF